MGSNVILPKIKSSFSKPDVKVSCNLRGISAVKTAIDNCLREVGKIFARAGYIEEDLDKLQGRGVGMALAGGMRKLFREIGFPFTLAEVPGSTEIHVRHCMDAAKNPKLESKLKNMPVPLTAKDVDEYMGSVLAAAVNGDMSLIKNLA